MVMPHGANLAAISGSKSMRSESTGASGMIARIYSTL
jgi:hypothetical protein